MSNSHGYRRLVDATASKHLCSHSNTNRDPRGKPVPSFGQSEQGSFEHNVSSLPVLIAFPKVRSTIGRWTFSSLFRREITQNKRKLGKMERWPHRPTCTTPPQRFQRSPEQRKRTAQHLRCVERPYLQLLQFVVSSLACLLSVPPLLAPRAEAVGRGGRSHQLLVASVAVAFAPAELHPRRRPTVASNAEGARLSSRFMPPVRCACSCRP